MTVNRVTLVGNLGRDAEIRNTTSGAQIASLRLATTDRRKGADGNWQDHTEWHSVVCFDKLATLMERFGKKGKQLYIEGRIQTREWTDKDGQKRWSTEIIAGEIRLLGGTGTGEGTGTGTGQPERSAPPRQAAKPATQAPADDYGGYDDNDPPF